MHAGIEEKFNSLLREKLDAANMNALGGGGVSLYSDDRDGNSYFLGVVIGDLVFLGVVQAKSFKKTTLVFVRV